MEYTHADLVACMERQPRFHDMWVIKALALGTPPMKII